MKINTNDQITASEVKMEGARSVRMKILIGLNEESDNIIMRHFIVAPGGNTPLHRHDYEHVVKIESNQGIAVDENGREHIVKQGQSLFVKPNEMHQFRNPLMKISSSPASSRTLIKVSNPWFRFRLRYLT